MDREKALRKGENMNREGNLCALIEDVLPMYVDGLVSQKTRNMVKGHLEECESCKSKYQKMSQRLPVQEPSEEAMEMLQSAPEIDYLKKVKRRGRRRMLSLALGLVLVFTVCIVWQRYCRGTATDDYSASVTIDEEMVKIEGKVKNGKAYADYAVREKDGFSRLVIYETEPSLWNNKKEFSITIPLEQAKRDELVVSEQRISASGQLLEEKTRNIYANKHPYIGDVSKNGALAEALDIETELGDCSSQMLQTDEEPYGWHFTFNKMLEGSTDELVFNEKMKGFACVLFACIDNLGEVSWSYMLQNQPEPVDQPKKCGTNEKQETFTVKKASKVLGQDVKAYGESEEKLQELLKLTGVLPSETTLSFSEEYPYRKVLTGKLGNNAVGTSTFVVLTRNKDVTFEQVSWSILSSSSNDWLDDTVIVDVY